MKQSREDTVLRRAREILSGAGSGGVDLAEEYASLASGYGALLRKLHKTLVISDSYQTQLLEFNNTLSQRIEEETERRLTQERLLAQRARLAIMGEMIDAIAHQWKQPLATLGIIVQTIAEALRQGKLDNAYMERSTASAMAQIRYMTETIATFREFFRPDKEREPFSVSVKIAEAAALLRSQLSDKGITLELGTAPGSDTLSGYPNEFVQIIVNLMANSCEAILERRQGETPPLTGRDTIRVQVAPSADRVVVEIRDNGIGIPPESAGRLFDPDFSTKKSREGSGLGLYMSRLLVEQGMGGTISSAADCGWTVFRLDLPRNEDTDART